MNGMSRMFGATLLLSAVLAVGGACEKTDDPKPADVPRPPAPDVTPKAGGGGGSSGGGSTVSKSPTTGPSAPATTAPISVTKTPGDLDASLVPPRDQAAAARSKEAQDLVAGAIVAINENRLDEARTSLDKVDAMGDVVPKTTREQAKTVRANLDNVARLQKTDLPLPTDGENK
jgi:hypothetical protein